MDASTFSITLPSQLRMLSVARSFVDAVCQACRLDRGTSHALIIVTGEAFSNVIRHAHENQPGRQIEIQLQILADTVVLTFIDQGAPFDLNAVPMLPPGELRIGGRGVYLMRTLMDELSCGPCPSGERGNILRMVKRCHAGDARACG
ncbi:MAG: ATP-binding protein [Gemmataceae bacterium]|nr:ATP-binding protein [Gemmataceae bacterium]